MTRLFVLVFLLSFFTVPGFAQTITNEDLEKKYGKAPAESSGEDQSEIIKQRREENSQALESYNCQQLKAAGKQNTMQYRNECYTPEQKAAWNERVRENRRRNEEAYRESRESQRDFREMQRDQKIDDIHRGVYGY